MKRYIVSEEELKELLICHIPFFGTNTISELLGVILDFLKSQKPVEEIAGGMVRFNEFGYPSFVIVKDNHETKYNFPIPKSDTLSVLKNYEILIKEVE